MTRRDPTDHDITTSEHTVTSSDRVLVSAGADDEDPASFTLMMRIQNVITADRGTYYCHANNTLGEASQAVQLQVETRPKVVKRSW